MKKCIRSLSDNIKMENIDKNIVIEKWTNEQQYKEKVFAAVFPHSDDFTIFAAGTILKFIQEGYKGYFIRLTNDEKDSYNLSVGETVYRIEKETRQVAKLLGITKVYDFNYKNHYMDYSQITEIRHRLMILFRFLKIDTVISFDPWGHYEENPEHYLAGKIVEAACWMAGRQLDLPELKDMNINPHFVKEKYYVARGPQVINRIIDISPVINTKYEAIKLHVTPISNMWRVYLEDYPDGSGPFKTIEQFIKKTFIEEACKPLKGIKYYEKFHYICQPY
jgi:LmbE family N-acetylglucosaminyl deacetylase